MSLTPKQEKFCQVYIETGNASEAYRQAYDVTKAKEATINRNAKAQLDHIKISARIESLRELHQKRHEVTVDSLTIEYEEARELAKGVEAPAAMVSATTGKAKLHGLSSDRHEHTGKDGGPIETKDVSDLEFARRLAHVLEKGANVKP